jgi:uncharacterized protein YkwD
VAGLALASLAACGSDSGGGGAIDAGPTGDGARPGPDGAAVPDAALVHADAAIVDAVPPPDHPIPSDASVEAMAFDALFAAFRSSLGMAPVPLDDHARQAAVNHCFYCDHNPGDCGLRENNPSGIGYTGENFWERMAAAGFVGVPFTEVMSFYGDPETAFAAWVASIYHRLPLVSYQSSAYGFGAGVACDTGDFGKSTPGDPDARSHWPRHGAFGIPTTAAVEFPELAPPPLGYPISLHAGSPIAVTAHSLTESASAAPVPVIFVDEASDPHDHVTAYLVYLVPAAPLEPGTSYDVSITGMQNSALFIETWSFSTAP